jgi:hypothetical protein
MLVLPQTTVNSNNGAVPTTATDFFVEVTYRLSNIQRTVRAAFTDINKLPQTDKKEGLTFEMGRQYALTLGFDDTDIKFDISVESWEAEEPELASAATTVVFNGNIPAGVSEGVEVEGIHAANSGFIYGKELPGLTTPPFLVGWIFLGYFDSRDGGTQYYDGSLTPQKVFDTDGDDEPDAVWDKAGPACTLYAQWVKFNPFWGQSNIYFKPDPDGDGSVGSLTFSEDDSSKFGYQGLYFKWGSLIGVSPTGTFNGDAYLYIPDVTTGKYYKVTVSDVKDSSVKAVSDFLDDAVPGWTGNNNGTYPNNDWSRIPYADESYDSGRGLSPLTDASNQAYYTSYKGDICKFLSDKKETNSSKLKRNWVMPISDVWKGDVSAQDYGVDIDGVYRYEKNSNWSGSGSFLPTTDVGGTGSTPTALMTYTATGETASFPASGYRYVDHGALNGVGSSGCYWSSSVGEGSGAHYLYAISSEVRPGIHGYRSWGMSVRCVQK